MSSGDEDFDRSIRIEEFRSLRAESSAAKSNQQSILQWTLAAVGVIVAGSVAATRSLDVSSGSRVVLILAIAYATVVPGIVACGFGVWIGEVQRMERAGRFLRIRERATWKQAPEHLAEPESLRALPAAWENVIYDSDPETQKEFVKNRVGSIAAAALFLGLIFSFLAMSVALSVASPAAFSGLTALRWVVVVWDLLFFVALVSLFATLLYRLSTRSTGPIPVVAGVHSRPVKSDYVPRLIDVVLPCLDEARALPGILDAMPRDYRAIVVANDCADESANIARELGATVIELDKRGVGRAISRGLDECTSDIVCVMDCDGTVSPSDLKELTKQIDEHTGLAIGTRVYRPNSAGFPRRALFRLTGLLASLRFRVKLRDLGSSMALNRRALHSEFSQLDKRYGWSIGVVRATSRRGLGVRGVPMPFFERVGHSKVTGTLTGSMLTISDTLKVLLQ